MGGQVNPTWWLWLGVLGAGCNTLAGIDGDFVRADDPFAGAGSLDSGAGAQGGFNGEGGASGNFGTGGTEGEGAGGTDGASGSDGMNPPDAAGGLDGAGGTDTVGGAAGTGGAACSSDQKRCGDACVVPSPTVGCSLADCNPCPDPEPNSELLCVDLKCVARCKSGFIPLGGQCVPEGSVDAAGGAGGSAGTAGSSGRGGSGGRCMASECPSCSIFRGIACCTFLGACGCGFVDRFYCL